jgi:GGDEF domain-containing protein
VVVPGQAQDAVGSRRASTDAGEARSALKDRQAHLQEALREAQIARVDTLTGVANRAGLEDRLEQAFV